MKFAIIVAVASNGIIGKGDSLPWPKLPEDMAHFKKTTLGHTVVMGRKTWETLPTRFRPLSERFNIVMSRDPSYNALGAHVVSSLDDAIRLANNNQHPKEDDVAFIIGGAQLYELALPLADELVLTEIDTNFEGDASFPVWNRSDFDEIARDTRPASSSGQPAFAFVTYRRKL